MTPQPLPAPRFVRRTRLGPDEYRKNFHQIDREILAAVSSEEADRVTPLMSKIYLRLVNAPDRFWEREGVLRIEAEEKEEKLVTAWVVLCDLLGVSSATASKAIKWMREEGIVGYFAGKNGVGIRVFINRAASSIGTRAGQKILEFPRASSPGVRTSRNEAAFSDSFADPESLDTDSDPRAPKNGAEATEVVKECPDPHPALSRHLSQSTHPNNALPPQEVRIEVPVEEIVTRLRHDLEPSLQAAARQAAAREHERTREWLESRGLPKAARVAQREAFNVLRRYGVIREGVGNSSTHADVGRNGYAVAGPHPLSGEELEQLAQACVAMLEVQGQAIERTLSEMSSEVGGFLLSDDAARVRQKAEELLAAGGGMPPRRL